MSKLDIEIYNSKENEFRHKQIEVPVMKSCKFFFKLYHLRPFSTWMPKCSSKQFTYNKLYILVSMATGLYTTFLYMFFIVLSISTRFSFDFISLV